MSARPGAWRNQAGALLALLLLVLRLAVPTSAVLRPPIDLAGRDAAALARLLSGVPICHADSEPAPTVPEPADKPAIPAAHDCALCPVCHSTSVPALVPAATWVIAPIPVGQARVALFPPSTGPPKPALYAARPRGPPLSVV